MEISFETYLSDSIKKIQTKKVNDDGSINTEISSLSFYVIPSTTELLTILYEPSLCIIFQGAKAIILDHKEYIYDPSRYLLASVHMPARVRIIEGSHEEPYIALKLTFTMEDVFEVIKETDKMHTLKPTTTERGLCFGDMTTELLDPLVRLIDLLDKPSKIKFMAPLIIKEILYLIIKDKGGDFIRKYLMDGSIVQQIVKVISKIKQDFAETLNMQELAKSYGMSESSLYHNFKKITMMSPLQFQKTLRLQEARSLLLTKNLGVTEIAFAVGYESPSQFSREYTRMFGLPPKTYAKAIQDETENIA